MAVDKTKVAEWVGKILERNGHQLTEKLQDYNHLIFTELIASQGSLPTSEKETELRLKELGKKYTFVAIAARMGSAMYALTNLGFEIVGNTSEKYREPMKYLYQYLAKGKPPDMVVSILPGVIPILKGKVGTKRQVVTFHSNIMVQNRFPMDGAGWEDVMQQLMEMGGPEHTMCMMPSTDPLEPSSVFTPNQLEAFIEDRFPNHTVLYSKRIEEHRKSEFITEPVVITITPKHSEFARPRA